MQPKLIKKSREYNSKDLILALYNIDNNKKGLYYEYMDGNSGLMNVARPNSQTSPGCTFDANIPHALHPSHLIVDTRGDRNIVIGEP